MDTRLAEAGMTREEYEAKAEAEYKKKHGIIDELDEDLILRTVPCGNDLFDAETLARIQDIGRTPNG